MKYTKRFTVDQICHALLVQVEEDLRRSGLQFSDCTASLALLEDGVELEVNDCDTGKTSSSQPSSALN